MNFPQNDLPIRTPFINVDDGMAPAATENVSLGQLQNIQTDMADKLEELQTFHAINMADSELKVKQQIVANKKAYDILLPIYQSLEAAIEEAKSNQQGSY